MLRTQSFALALSIALAHHLSGVDLVSLKDGTGQKPMSVMSYRDGVFEVVNEAGERKDIRSSQITQIKFDANCPQPVVHDRLSMRTNEERDCFVTEFGSGAFITISTKGGKVVRIAPATIRSIEFDAREIDPLTGAKKEGTVRAEPLKPTLEEVALGALHFRRAGAVRSCRG